jgi:hypothetical protein
VAANTNAHTASTEIPIFSAISPIVRSLSSLARTSFSFVWLMLPSGAGIVVSKFIGMVSRVHRLNILFLGWYSTGAHEQRNSPRRSGHPYSQAAESLPSNSFARKGAGVELVGTLGCLLLYLPRRIHRTS